MTTQGLCPTCQRELPLEIGVCPDDGARLIEVKTSALQPGDVLDDRFEIVRQLGRGGMGEVYLARQRVMERDVAVKILRPERIDANRVARFLREARATSQLTHPNTVRVFDFGQSSEGTLFLVMEFLDGQPLSTLLAHTGQLSLERTAPIVAQICDSLAEAHEKGIVHRDLKPDNVFLQRTVGNPDFVKVLDFGIAKLLEPAPEDGPITREGAICGTPQYMSPEMFYGEEVTSASDIFALGAMTYQLLSGSLPYEGDTPMAIMMRQSKGPPPALTRVPDGVATLVSRALERDPERRPASAQAFKHALSRALDVNPGNRETAEFDAPLAGSALFTAEMEAPTSEVDLSATSSPTPDPLPPEVPLESEPATPPPRPLRIWMVGVVVLIALASLWFLLRDNSPPEVDSGPPPPTPVASIPSIRLEVSTAAGTAAWLGPAVHKLLAGHLQQGEAFQLVTEDGPETRPLYVEVIQQDNRVALSASLERDDALAYERSTTPVVLDLLSTEVDILAYELRLESLGPEAAPSITPMARLAQSSPQAYANGLIMRDAMDRELEQRARESLDAAMRIDPGFHVARLDYAYWLVEWLGEMKEPKRMVNEVLAATTPESFEGQYALAMQAYLNTDFRRALELFVELSKAHPMEGAIRRHLITAALDLRDGSTMKAALERFAQADPVYAASRYHIDLAFLYSTLGEHEKAIEHARRYIEARPQLFEAQYRMGLIQRNAGYYDAALEHFQLANSLVPTTWTVADVANVHMRRGQFDKAIELIAEKFDEEGTVRAEETWMVLVDIGEEKRDTRGVVLEELKPLLEGVPEDEHLLSHGWVAVFLGELDRANSLAQRFIDGGAAYWRLYNAAWIRLQIMLERKQSTLVKNQVARVCQLLETDWYAEDECGLIQARSGLTIGDLDYALEGVQAALKYCDRRGHTHYVAGEIYEARGEMEKAREHYARFLELYAQADEGLAMVAHARRVVEGEEPRTSPE